jgi:hypothetical protein
VPVQSKVYVCSPWFVESRVWNSLRGMCFVGSGLCEELNTRSPTRRVLNSEWSRNTTKWGIGPKWAGDPQKKSALFDQRATLFVGKFLVMIFLQRFRRQLKAAIFICFVSAIIFSAPKTLWLSEYWNHYFFVFRRTQIDIMTDLISLVKHKPDPKSFPSVLLSHLIWPRFMFFLSSYHKYFYCQKVNN